MTKTNLELTNDQPLILIFRSSWNLCHTRWTEVGRVNLLGVQSFDCPGPQDPSPLFDPISKWSTLVSWYHCQTGKGLILWKIGRFKKNLWPDEFLILGSFCPPPSVGRGVGGLVFPKLSSGKVPICIHVDFWIPQASVGSRKLHSLHAQLLLFELLL